MAQVEQTKLLAEIAKDEDHAYFDTLSKNEAGIDWLGFAAKIYRKSHSTSTITSYCKGICAFQGMLAQNGKTLDQTITEIKAEKNGLAYKLLDEFVTYCDATKQYAPRTTRNCYLAVTRLFRFLEIELDDNKLEDIDLPTPQDLLDEYPNNEVIRAILNAATLRIRGFVQVMIDTGLEPTDTAQLQVKDVKFDEAIPRIFKNREKTGHKLEGFLNTGTVETLTQIMRIENKQADDYLFTDKAFTNYTLRSIRDGYNLAVAKAGFGKLKRIQTKAGPKYRGLVEKIEGHKFGKYHLKIYKKRWLTLAISPEVQAYTAQAMLGRGAYLKQYYILPLEKRQEYARKILKAVNPYADKADKQETVKQLAQMLGLKADDLTDEKIAAIQGLLGRVGQFATLPVEKLQQINKLLSGETA